MHCISTFTGRKVDLVNPRPEQIDIADIACGLANESRFNGQTGRLYSVAQHSVEASFIVPREDRLEALLHDATEAYMKDIPAPLKALLPEYRAIERRLDAVIRERFGLSLIPSRAVAEADMIMRATEKRDFMPTDTSIWPSLEGVIPLTRTLYPSNPTAALGMFYRRWMEIQGSMIGVAA